MRDLPRRRAAVVAACCLVLPIVGCGGGGEGSNAGKTLAVYVSAPLSGPDARYGKAIVDGAKLALAQGDGRVGALKIRPIYMDDTGKRGGWDPVVTAGNARRASEDSSAIAYIGEFDSAATTFSLPITNQAEMLQISPAATAVDLTRDVPGGEDPDRLRPSDKQTFARLVPADDVQARAAARWAKQVGVRRIIPLLSVPDLGTVADRTRLTSPVFGWPTLALDPQPSAPPGAGASGRDFVDAYLKRYGRVPGPYAAQGYEAMAVVLDSIRRAGEGGDDRGDVVDALLETRNRRSPIGTYSIEPNGETTFEVIAGLRIRDGRPFFDRPLRG